MSVGRRSPISAGSSGSTTPGGSAGGDLAGSYPNPTVKTVTGDAGNTWTQFSQPYIVWPTTGLPADPAIYVQPQTTDSPAQSLSFVAGAPWASATGANRAAPNMAFYLAAPTAGGTEANLVYLRNFVPWITIAPDASLNTLAAYAGNLKMQVPAVASNFYSFCWLDFNGGASNGEKIRISMSGTDAFIDNKGVGNLYLRNTVASLAVVIQNTGSSGNVYIAATGSGSQALIQSNTGLLQDASSNTIFGWGTEPTAVIGTANFASDADLTVAAASYRYEIIQFTGTQTTRNAVMPTTSGAKHFFQNKTTSTVTVKTLAGTGFTLGASRGAWGFCDGTNYVRMTADSVFT